MSRHVPSAPRSTSSHHAAPARRPLAAITAISALAAVAVLALGGCAGTQSTTPRSRVAKDLGCTTEGTGVRKLAAIAGENAARWEVSGCGRTAVYVCTTPVRDCWREGEIQQAPEASR